MKNKAAISADIVSSTALNVKDRLSLEKSLLELLETLEQTFGRKKFYGRLIKGDYIECVFVEPGFALRAALIIKSFVKSLQLSQNEDSKQIRAFFEHGIRIAVGVGEIRIFDREKGIIDGEAIYLSGRSVNELSNQKHDRTLIFRTNKVKYKVFEAVFELLDVQFASFTRAQSEVVYYKLLDKSEKEITTILNKAQSTVNQHINSVGWRAIEKTVKIFETIIK